MNDRSDTVVNRIKLVTVVWGERFIDQFLRNCIASLSTTKNLPYLASLFKCEYHIYTYKEYIGSLENSVEIEFLKTFLKIKIVEISSKISKDDTTHSVAWTEAIKKCHQDEIVWFIIPDAIYISDALMRWANYIQLGYRFIYTLGLQISLEYSSERIEEYRTVRGEVNLIEIDRLQANDIVTRFLHPLYISKSRQNGFYSGHPEFVLTFCKSGGMVASILGQHPMVLFPPLLDSNKSLGISNNLDLIAFDDISLFGMEPNIKYSNTYFNNNEDVDYLINIAGNWMHDYCARSNLLELQHTRLINVKFNKAYLDIREHSNLINKLKFSYRLYNITEKLYDLGMYNTANIILLSCYLNDENYKYFDQDNYNFLEIRDIELKYRNSANMKLQDIQDIFNYLINGNKHTTVLNNKLILKFDNQVISINLFKTYKGINFPILADIISNLKHVFSKFKSIIIHNRNILFKYFNLLFNVGSTICLIRKNINKFFFSSNNALIECISEYNIEQLYIFKSKFDDFGYIPKGKDYFNNRLNEFYISSIKNNINFFEKINLLILSNKLNNERVSLEIFENVRRSILFWLLASPGLKSDFYYEFHILNEFLGNKDLSEYYLYRSLCFSFKNDRFFKYCRITDKVNIIFKMLLRKPRLNIYASTYKKLGLA